MITPDIQRTGILTSCVRLRETVSFVFITQDRKAREARILIELHIYSKVAGVFKANGFDTLQKYYLKLVADPKMMFTQAQNKI
jgi:hypothetical protein